MIFSIFICKVLWNIVATTGYCGKNKIFLGNISVIVCDWHLMFHNYENFLICYFDSEVFYVALTAYSKVENTSLLRIEYFKITKLFIDNAPYLKCLFYLNDLNIQVLF